MRFDLLLQRLFPESAHDERVLVGPGMSLRDLKQILQTEADKQAARTVDMFGGDLPEDAESD